MNSCDYQQIMIHGEPLGKILPNIYQIKFKSHVSGMYYMLYVLLPDHLIKNKIKRRERERHERSTSMCFSACYMKKRSYAHIHTPPQWLLNLSTRLQTYAFAVFTAYTIYGDLSSSHTVSFTVFRFWPLMKSAHRSLIFPVRPNNCSTLPKSYYILN